MERIATDSTNTLSNRHRGAQPGNRNRLRHGLKAGKLPLGAQYIENRVNAFRRELEDAVLAVKRDVSIIDAASINTASKWERHGLLAQHWLRKEAHELSPIERLKFSETIAKASENRDRMLRALELDRDADHSIIDALYSRVVSSDDPNGNLEDK